MDPGRAVRQRVAVRRVLSAEMMAFDRTGIALADGGADHIDQLAWLKPLNSELGAGLECRCFIG